MDLKALLNNPLLSLVGRFVPQARPIVDFIRSHETVIEAGMPVVAAAIREGGSAFAAAKAKAPEFSAAVVNLVKLLPAGAVAGAQPDIHIENITRSLAGFHSMTHDEEMAWMDRATPHNDPSQENSKFGG